MWYRAHFLVHFLMGLSLLFAGGVQAQSHVYVKNDSQVPLQIQKSKTGGAHLSNKAWMRGASSVAPGAREIVLSLKRKGKNNWMDPTPRFVEPGKEVVFSTIVSVGESTSSSMVLLQKLLGTGKTTKMWYSIDAGSEKRQWYIDESMHRVDWARSGAERWAIQFRSFRQKGETHVEYTFSRP